MRPQMVVLDQPGIEISLQLIDAAVDLLAERNPVKLVQDSAMEALTDSIGLRALGLGAAVIDVLDRARTHGSRGRRTRCHDRSACATTGCRARRRTAPPDH